MDHDNAEKTALWRYHLVAEACNQHGPREHLNLRGGASNQKAAPLQPAAGAGGRSTQANFLAASTRYACPATANRTIAQAAVQAIACHKLSSPAPMRFHPSWP
jgi:hypothetical protein